MLQTHTTVKRKAAQMTATRNTLFAFGLTLLVLAAGHAASGQTAACGASGCDAPCQANCQTGGAADPLQGFRARTSTMSPAAAMRLIRRAWKKTRSSGTLPPFSAIFASLRRLRLEGRCRRPFAAPRSPGSASLLLDPNTRRSSSMPGGWSFLIRAANGSRWRLWIAKAGGWRRATSVLDSWSVEQDLPRNGGTVTGGTANLVADGAHPGAAVRGPVPVDLVPLQR